MNQAGIGIDLHQTGLYAIGNLIGARGLNMRGHHRINRADRAQAMRLVMQDETELGERHAAIRPHHPKAALGELEIRCLCLEQLGACLYQPLLQFAYCYQSCLAAYRQAARGPGSSPMGVTAVSPCTILTDSRSIPNASAISCARPVSNPCP